MKPKKEQARIGHPLRLIKSDLETEILQQEDLSNFVLKCPRCSSLKIVKCGRSNGKQKFQCQDCKRQFVHPLLRDEKNKKSKAPIENPEVYCYHCESQKRDFVYHGKDELGRTRFYCNDCKKWFVDPKQRFVPDIACPKCNRYQCSKRGTSASGKQKYYCPKCDYRFVENPGRKFYGYNLPLGDDVWDARELGVKIHAYSKDHTKFILTRIKQPWLKNLAKKFIRFRSTTRGFHTLNYYLTTFNNFSKFIEENYSNVSNIKKIDRELIIDYIHYLNRQNFKAQTVISHLGTIKLFFEDGNINGWFKISPHLIRLEDYPKSKKPLPRYIPEEVIKQLNQHIDKLPEQLMRIVLVLQECGLRIGEALTLSFDCLRQDTQGDWFLFITRHKMKVEQNIPISRELVAVIQEQQQYIKDNLSEDFDYLFCGRQKGGIGNNKFLPEAKLMSPQSFSIYLNRLAKEENITDSNGKIWRFQSHQFRHTVGTRMINNNVPQHIVQKYLGHESPTMTMRYAHIHDQTLKKEIAQFHDSRVVNVAGEVVESTNAELDTNLDLHLIKKNVLAQALSNGSCARPIQLGECPHANACLTCGDFRTTIEFLDQHKTQLEETEKLVQNAEAKGWKRQAEMNARVRDNLKKIITTLESEDNK
jgi:integrase/transposase-like protein